MGLPEILNYICGSHYISSDSTGLEIWITFFLHFIFSYGTQKDAVLSEDIWNILVDWNNLVGKVTVWLGELVNWLFSKVFVLWLTAVPTVWVGPAVHSLLWPISHREQRPVMLSWYQPPETPLVRSSVIPSQTANVHLQFPFSATLLIASQ